jgi:hypothetical protein
MNLEINYCIDKNYIEYLMNHEMLVIDEYLSNRLHVERSTIINEEQIEVNDRIVVTDRFPTALVHTDNLFCSSHQVDSILLNIDNNEK